MIRILIITAVSGLLISFACLGGASALGFNDVLKNGWNWNAYDITIDEETDDLKIVPAKDGKGSFTVNGRTDGDTGDYAVFFEGPTQTREFAWTGAGEIDIGMPADVTYTQGPAPKIVVTAPTGSLDRFYVERENFRLRGWSSSNTFNGVPTADNLSGANRPPRLKIEVTAPGVTRFDLSGSETITIENYAQDTIEIDLTGAAKATVKGYSRVADLDLSGIADADLSGLKLVEADVELSGESKATLGPEQSLEADVSGRSRLILTRQPPRMRQDVSGASVIESAQAAPPAKTK